MTETIQAKITQTVTYTKGLERHQYVIERDDVSPDRVTNSFPGGPNVYIPREAAYALGKALTGVANPFGGVPF